MTGTLGVQTCFTGITLLQPEAAFLHYIAETNYEPRNPRVLDCLGQDPEIVHSTCSSLQTLLAAAKNTSIQEGRAFDAEYLSRRLWAQPSWRASALWALDRKIAQEEPRQRSRLEEAIETDDPHLTTEILEWAFETYPQRTQGAQSILDEMERAVEKEALKLAFGPESSSLMNLLALRVTLDAIHALARPEDAAEASLWLAAYALKPTQALRDGFHSSALTEHEQKEFQTAKNTLLLVKNDFTDSLSKNLLKDEQPLALAFLEQNGPHYVDEAMVFFAAMPSTKTERKNLQNKGDIAELAIQYALCRSSDMHACPPLELFNKMLEGILALDRQKDRRLVDIYEKTALDEYFKTRNRLVSGT